MMKLLTFAHRGEAQAFFSAYTFSPVEFFFDGLFRSEQFFLLITGEGSQIASEKTISVLATYNFEIDEVFNIGVAGSLNPKCKKNDLFWIRTSYAHHAERLEFKSFSSKNKTAVNDCMTAFARVLDPGERLKFSHFANIVDRELWAVASAAHLFKKPIESLKIISDDQTTSANDICQLVKEEAPALSEKLLKEFQNHLKINPKKEQVKTGNSFLDDPHFYFTTSQERKLASLVQGLKLKNIHPEALDLSAIKDSEVLPKEKTKLLLQYLNDELNPMAKTLRMALAKKLAPLNEASIITSFDNDFEQDWLNLSMKIQSTRDLEKCKNALKIFSYEDFKKVFNGDIDV